MIARVITSAAAALFTVLAVFSGADRMSALDPALARLVPPVFAGEAAKVSARSALVQGSDATEVAEAAVSAMPYDVHALGLLGTAQLGAGDVQGADAAFRLSARLGWRDAATQLYWFEIARNAGDWDRAALRADAILRADPQFAHADALFANLQGEAASEALARRIASRPAWLPYYLQPRGDTGPEELVRRAGILSSAPLAAAPLGCDAPAPLARGLLRASRRTAAERLWSVHCPDEQVEGGLVDPQFAGDGTSPFGWRRHPTGDVRIARLGDAGGVALGNDAAVARLALSQAVALQPGRYRVDQSGAGLQALAISVDCGGTPSRPRFEAASRELTVPDCPDQVIGLWIARKSERATLRSLALRPVG